MNKHVCVCFVISSRDEQLGLKVLGPVLCVGLQGLVVLLEVWAQEPWFRGFLGLLFQV